LHGGAQPGNGSHHVMVALFDASTGTRIVDAEVRASVDDRSPARPLEPMQVNGMMTYGNFFALGSGSVRRIRVEIALAGGAVPIVATFAYRHDPGT
jgi:hypothetical protein